MEQFKIEQIIYGSFVKMERLRQLTINTFSNTSIASATELNIFIDFYSVIKSVFSEHGVVDTSDYTAITSGLINMCSHYRSFYKQLSVKTNFYIVYSFNTSELNRKFVAEYNSEFLRKTQIPLFDRMVNDNMELLNLICPYLPDIHFIKSANNYESTLVIANLIEQYGINIPNLIISKDLYPLQLTYLYPYTSYLYPLKRKTGDESIMIPISEKYNYRYEFWNLVSTIRKIDVNSILNISPVNFPLFSAMNRFPERNISTCYLNVAAVRKVIKSIVGEDDIVIYPEQLYADENISSIVPVNMVEARLKALDIRYTLPYYKADPESKSIKLLNLSDDGAINMINSEFFSHNPLDLNKL